jgi:protein SCO1/2
MSIQTLRLIRYGAIALIAVLGLFWAATWLGLFQRQTAPSFGGPVIGAFQMTDQNGKAVSERDLIGRPAAVFFGFTYCPDVCPTTLASMTALMGKLGADADRLGVFFVTVDPARDTQQALKAYLGSFDPRIRGLTGTHEQLASMAKPLGVYYARAGEGDNYTMDHTASVFLLDAQGRFHGTIAYGEDGATALEKLRALLR